MYDRSSIAIYGLLKHPTDIGLAQFVADFEKGNK
jgi:transaldolase